MSAAKDNTTTISQDTSKDINQEKIGIDDSSLNKEILKINHENTTLKEPVSGGTFNDIQTAINNASSGSIIELSGLYNGDGTEIKIDKNNLTIIGKDDATLDGQRLSRIFNITGNGVTLKNIKFINGKIIDDDGGAIYWDGDNGIVKNCTFNNNKAEYFGGAIKWIGSNGTVTNCNFTQNTVDQNGGAIYWDGENGILNQCTLNNNTAVDYGGVISWNGDNGTVKNCNINNNIANYGGVIRWEGENGFVTNSNFTQNTANTDGGILYWRGVNGNVNQCTFNNNTAVEHGGAIYWDKYRGTITNCTFNNNKAKYGGAIYWNDYKGAIINCTFYQNTANTDGGAIDWYGDNGTVKNCTFNNNKAEYDGAIIWEGENGTLNQCTFNQNTANYGGAIDWTGVNGNVSYCNFNNNTADEDGGATYWEGENGTLNQCTFNNNKANKTGGATYWYEKNGTITNCTFSQNTANTDGGAIYWNSTEGDISNSIFKGNKAKNYRNIYTENDDLNLYNSSLETIITIKQIPDCVVGNSATVKFTFDDGTNLGGYNVTLYNNNELIKTFNYNSTYNYTYSWDNLAAGDYSITVEYADNNKNKYVADVKPMNFIVKKVINPTDINVTVTPGKCNVTVKVTAPKDFTGNVNVIIDNVNYPIEVINGIGSEVIPLTTGKHNITEANITNNTMYDDISIPENISFVVLKKDTIITAGDISFIINYGGRYTVSTNLGSGKTITLIINNQNINAITDANGVATFKLTKANLAPAGVKTATIIFNGDDNYTSYTINTKITVNKETTKITGKSAKKTYKKTANKKIRITLKDSTGKSLGKVKIHLKAKKLKGKLGKKLKKGYYITVKFNKKGIGYITLKNSKVNGFKKGTYKFTVTYKGNNIYKPSKSKIKMKIK